MWKLSAILLLPAIVRSEDLFEVPKLKENWEARSGRVFNLTGLLGLPSRFVRVNQSALAYGTGAILATTFLGAAVVANLNKKEEDNKKEVKTETTTMSSAKATTTTTKVPYFYYTRRKDSVDSGCNCEAYCYDTYFRPYYEEIMTDGGEIKEEEGR